MIGSPEIALVTRSLCTRMVQRSSGPSYGLKLFVGYIGLPVSLHHGSLQKMRLLPWKDAPSSSPHWRRPVRTPLFPVSRPYPHQLPCRYCDLRHDRSGNFASRVFRVPDLAAKLTRSHCSPAEKDGVKILTGRWRAHVSKASRHCSGDIERGGSP